MRRIGWVLAVLLFQGLPASADYSLDMLKQELKQAKQTHDQTTTQNLSNFLDQLQAASASPDAAMDLYQKAGGAMPAAAPVQTQYAHETPDEKAERLARDQATLSNLGYVAQIHCGLMRFGGLFIVKPKTPGLHDQWIAWLKNAAQIYLAIKPNDPPPPADADPTANPQKGHGHRGARGGGGGGSGDTVATSFKNTALHDSTIGKFLGFHSWGDKTQGSWTVGNLPALYRSEVLEPLREHPTAATLEAWDVYIALQHADSTDPDKWDQVDSISLAFDRACDDYAITPNMEKLAALNKIVTDNPTHPKFDDMGARASQLNDDYASRHPDAKAVAAPTPAPSADSSVSVTETTQGDTTVIHTHVNSAPSTNAAPTANTPLAQ